MAKIRANSESIKRDRRIKEILLSFEREKEILNNQEAAKMAKEIPSDEKLRTMILNIGDDISVKATKLYVAFIRKGNLSNNV